MPQFTLVAPKNKLAINRSLSMRAELDVPAVAWCFPSLSPRAIAGNLRLFSVINVSGVKLDGSLSSNEEATIMQASLFRASGYLKIARLYGEGP